MWEEDLWSSCSLAPVCVILKTGFFLCVLFSSPSEHRSFVVNAQSHARHSSRCWTRYPLHPPSVLRIVLSVTPGLVGGSLPGVEPWRLQCFLHIWCGSRLPVPSEGGSARPRAARRPAVWRPSHQHALAVGIKEKGELCGSTDWRKGCRLRPNFGCFLTFAPHNKPEPPSREGNYLLKCVHGGLFILFPGLSAPWLFLPHPLH